MATKRRWIPKTIPTAPSQVPLFNYEESKNEASVGLKTSKLACSKLSKQACSTQSERCRYDPNSMMCVPKGISPSGSYALHWFSSRAQWRTNIMSWLTEASCNLTEYMNHIKILGDKKSSSPTIIISGTIQPTAMDKLHSLNKNVIAKISFPPESPLENGLKVEIAIYKNIITQLVNSNNTPHVTSYLGLVECGNLKLPFQEQQVYLEQVEKLKEAIENGYESSMDIKSPVILFTERSNGETLADWMNMRRTLADILAVTFQILYTLLCFSRIGLQHNDLHPGNIFIENMNEPITLFYQKGPDEYVQVTSPWIAKIYDWDRSSIIHPSVPLNLLTTINYCEDFGTCEYYNPKFDLFQFIAVMNQFLLLKVNPSIEGEFSGWIKNILDWSWYMDVGSRERGHALKFLEIPTDNQLKPASKVLNEFLKYSWSSKPFSVISGSSSSIPPQILFTPPHERVRKRDDWRPESKDSRQSLSEEQMSNLGNMASRFCNILSMWMGELYKDGIDTKKLTVEFRNQLFLKRKQYSEIRAPFFSDAIYWICCYQFHRLSKKEQDALLDNSSLKSVIDDIWNIFEGRLPISIPRFILEDA